jgi:hypothetical protein
MKDMKPYLCILVAIAPLSLDMPVEESIAFQRLSDREIKTRLSPPDASIPPVTAMQSGSRQADYVRLEVRCGQTAESARIPATMHKVRAARN